MSRSRPHGARVRRTMGLRERGDVAGQARVASSLDTLLD
jgi:hypothetical protein